MTNITRGYFLRPERENIALDIEPLELPDLQVSISKVLETTVVDSIQVLEDAFTLFTAEAVREGDRFNLAATTLLPEDLDLEAYGDVVITRTDLEPLTLDDQTLIFQTLVPDAIVGDSEDVR